MSTKTAGSLAALGITPTKIYDPITDNLLRGTTFRVANRGIAGSGPDIFVSVQGLHFTVSPPTTTSDAVPIAAGDKEYFRYGAEGLKEIWAWAASSTVKVDYGVVNNEPGGNG